MSLTISERLRSAEACVQAAQEGKRKVAKDIFFQQFEAEDGLIPFVALRFRPGVKAEYVAIKVPVERYHPEHQRIVEQMVDALMKPEHEALDRLLDRLLPVPARFRT